VPAGLPHPETLPRRQEHTTANTSHQRQLFDYEQFTGTLSFIGEKQRKYGVSDRFATDPDRSKEFGKSIHLAEGYFRAIYYI
jgi:hypothetical protein